MKKKFDGGIALCVIVIILIVCLVVGSIVSRYVFGNRQLLDVTNHFEYAVVRFPDDRIVEGKVQSWKDFEDGDQIQVKIDGTSYLVHATDVILISGWSESE